MQDFKRWLLVPFAFMESDLYSVKMGAVLLLTVVISPLVWLNTLLQEQLFISPSFIKVLVFLLFADLVLGVAKHLKQRTFDWMPLFTGFITKVAISFIGMAVFNSFCTLEELAALPELQSYLMLTGKVANFVYVGGSVFNNMFILSGGKFPPVAWMARMQKFQKTLNLEDLRKGGERANRKEVLNQVNQQENGTD